MEAASEFLALNESVTSAVPAQRKRRLAAHAAVILDITLGQPTSLIEKAVAVVVGRKAATITSASAAIRPDAGRSLTALAAIVVDLFATQRPPGAVVVARCATIAPSAIWPHAGRRLGSHAAVVLKIARIVLSIGR